MKKLFSNQERNVQKRKLLAIILKDFLKNRHYSDVVRFKLDYEDEVHVIEEIIAEQLCYDYENKLKITLKGLLKTESEESKKIIEDINTLLPVLQKLFKDEPRVEHSTNDVATEARMSVQAVFMSIYFLNFLLDVIGDGSMSDGIFYDKFKLKDGVRKFKSFEEGVNRLNEWKKSHKVSIVSRWLPWVKAHIFQIIMALIALATLFNTTYSTYFKK